jgi:plasmid maintenance system antidote protein VapI
MIVETLRKYVQRCGKTRYRISKESGVDESVLCRLVQGKSCGGDTIDRLCKYFGLELTAKRGKKKAR